MSNTLRVTLRSLNLPLKTKNYKFPTYFSLSGVRFLYAKSTLGIDAFKDQKEQIKRQMEHMEERFRERMKNFTSEDSTNMIFTEDLKNMVHLSETDDDFDLVVKMAKKFHNQNQQLRFGSFVFGPILMRMFHMYNKPVLAYECFKSPELNGLFDQLITFQILLDLLFENGKYQEMFEVFEIIKNKQIQNAKYPRNAVVLVMAACYKLNNEKSTEYAINLWNELIRAGHFPMRRAATFCAGLMINQEKPHLALEILSSVNKPNYVTIRNIKAKAYAQLGRLEDSISVLKSVISDDVPGDVKHTFNRDVLDYIQEKVAKTDSPEISLEFNKLLQLFEKEGHVSDLPLNDLLCSEIQQPPVMTNRQSNKYSRYNPNQSKKHGQIQGRWTQRPGLSDLN